MDDVFGQYPLLSSLPNIAYKRKPGRPKVSEQDKVERWLKEGGSPNTEVKWRRRALKIIRSLETSIEEM